MGATWQEFCGPDSSALFTTIIAGAVRRASTVGQMDKGSIGNPALYDPRKTPPL